MVTLNSIFCNDMIMQANKPVRFFGSGDGNVSVELNGVNKSTVSNGKWLIEFDAMGYGGPYEIKVMLDDKSIILNNVFKTFSIIYYGKINSQGINNLLLRLKCFTFLIKNVDPKKLKLNLLSFWIFCVVLLYCL